MDATRRHRPGKLRFDEIPPRALQEVARAATVGAGRSSDELPVSVQFAALMRHAVSFYTGEDQDPADQHKHMAAVSLRAMHLLETVRRIEAGELPAELDDRLKT